MYETFQWPVKTINKHLNIYLQFVRTLKIMFYTAVAPRVTAMRYSISIIKVL